MKAYIRVIYSSEGRPPADVTKIMREKGFHKVKGQPLFEGDISDEGELDHKMTELHSALHGMEVRYIPSLGSPADAEGALQIDIRDALKQLSVLLETDPTKFKHEASSQFKAKVDLVMAAREKEIREAEEKRLQEERERELREAEERKLARITTMFGREGGVTFHQLTEDSGLDADEAGDLIKDMVDNGRLRAVQKGRNVVYVTA
jgi:ribosomal protein S25